MADRTVTALMPMKGHSERVPNKNMRNLCGRPLFFWMLDALTAARSVGEVVIDTDSTAIADQAKAHFDVTILPRPDHLLGDMVGINPLIEYDLSQCSGEYFLQTHSTNPLVTAESVDRAVATFFEGLPSHDSLFSVTALQTRLYDRAGHPLNHDPARLVRTQDLEPVMEENSCLYVFSRTGFEDAGHRIGRSPQMMTMERFESIDIDEEYDFALAEAVMNRRLDTEAATTVEHGR